MQVFGFPNVAFASAVAVMHAERGTHCKLFKDSGVWYVAI